MNTLFRGTPVIIIIDIQFTLATTTLLLLLLLLLFSSSIDYLITNLTSAMPTSIDFVRNSIKVSKNLMRRAKITSNLQFSCGVCLTDVKYGEHSIQCTSCDKWIRLNCTNMTLLQFDDIIEDNKKNPDLIHTAEWHCPKSTFPFYDLTNIDLNINTTDNMAIFNLMPEFSITSNVDKVY